MIIQLIDEAVQAGARREKATALLGLSPRAVARWRVDSDTRGAPIPRSAAPSSWPLGNLQTSGDGGPCQEGLERAGDVWKVIDAHELARGVELE